ncbi:RadC family protein [Halanaerobacter jeridensis]|uniref:DNA repair protein RadC n=1 Tax=Halanaerobacter jeridensis TaxID=706427 RepID=A0A938XRM3_9FIRM|nr:DNA repair protein RadC [Halanaerobacter jeridensis]MBM7556180.1 DNA repair protein RadC [Halanaerobacter jeridensis]
MADYITIKDLPAEERPREKLLKYGVEGLSTTELLAIVLGTGYQNSTALDLANQLLAVSNGLSCLINYSIEELKKIKGIGLAKAAQLKAVGQLSQKLAMQKINLEHIKSPSDVAQILIARLGHLQQEKFEVVLLNTKHKVIGIKEISRGSLNSSIVHPREVFRIAIKRSSAAIIVAHNHPSGDLTPSQEDIQLTKRLIKAGEIVGIDLLDHLIIAHKNYSSLKEKELL